MNPLAGFPTRYTVNPFPTAQHNVDNSPQQQKKIEIENHKAVEDLNLDETSICRQYEEIQKTIRSSSIKAQQIQEQFIKEQIQSQPFIIKSDKVQHILKCTGLKVEELMQILIVVAKTFSLSSISNYKVGVVGLGASGNIYLGCNVEFPNFQLSQSIHGEQFLIANLKNNNDQLNIICLSAAPCGHCRQFMNEIGDDALQILIPNHPPLKLSNLLPEAFGPKDLGYSGGLLTSSSKLYKSDHKSPLTAKAQEAAYSSYAPYTECFSGVAIKTKTGNIYTGAYLENAAFNPSLSPLQSCLVSLLVGNEKFEDIEEVVLAQKSSPKVDQKSITKELLNSIAPFADFRLEILPDHFGVSLETSLF